jgi:dTDP-4-dehydrorhamnose 3,5-epimerase
MDKKLNITATTFNGLFIIEPKISTDDRGSFSRIFCSNELNDLFKFNIKQINHSITKEKGTVRGLHFQYEPNAEVKMVRCIKGKVLDIIVDIRKDSETFLQYFFIELTSKIPKTLYIPKGMAHGFQTLEDNTELLYFHSSIYTPNNEGALNIADPKLKIKLPIEITNISDRDKTHKFLNNNFKGIIINEM